VQPEACGQRQVTCCVALTRCFLEHYSAQFGRDFGGRRSGGIMQQLSTISQEKRIQFTGQAKLGFGGRAERQRINLRQGGLPSVLVVFHVFDLGLTRWGPAEVSAELERDGHPETCRSALNSDPCAEAR
jgi:hypothetical protein